MLVCGDCGASNEEGEDFCGECGAYLDWDAERVAVEPEPAVVAVEAVEPPDQPRGFVGRVREAVGIGGTTDDAAASPEADAPVREEAAATPDAVPEPVASTATATEAPADAASSLVVKVPPARPQPEREKQTGRTTEAPAARQPSPDQPGAVRPGAAAPKARRRSPTPAREPIDHGDLVCGRCGAGNKPTRKFCRRCGHDLVDAVVAKVPWWKRIFARGKKKPAAGTRPKPVRRKRRRPTKLLVLVVILGLLAFAGWSYRDAARGAYEAAADRVLGSEPFHPELSASSQAAGAPAARANDGASNRFWAPSTTGNPKGEFLRARFDRPFRLTSLIITAGVSTEEPRFLRHGRPSVLRLVVTDSAGEVFRERLELQDRAGPQTFDVTYADVERVRLVVVSSVRGSVRGTRMGVAEVEYLGRD